MIVQQDATHFWAIGENLDDVQRWLATTPARWGSVNSSRTNSMNSRWDLNVGYEGALRLAQTGWSEGVDKLSDKLDAHMPQRDHVDSWRYDVAGELPDIGRFLAGDPAHMRRHGHPKGHKPIISILVNICCAARVNAIQFVNYGAAVCSVIDQLENSGRRVELNVAWVSNIGGVRVSVGWTVKRAEDALDLAAIAYSLAHPAASRRLGFAMCERSNARPCVSYGVTQTPKASDWIDPSPGMYVIQGVGYGGSNTLEEALAHVVREVNKAAGEELVTVEG